jgi:Phycobilisome degradation protein nblA
MNSLSEALSLTMEQSFQLKIMADQVENLTVEDLQNAVLELTRQMMIKDNVLKHLMKGGS